MLVVSLQKLLDITRKNRDAKLQSVLAMIILSASGSTAKISAIAKSMRITDDRARRVLNIGYTKFDDEGNVSIRHPGRRFYTDIVYDCDACSLSSAVDILAVEPSVLTEDPLVTAIGKTSALFNLNMLEVATLLALYLVNTQKMLAMKVTCDLATVSRHVGRDVQDVDQAMKVLVNEYGFASRKSEEYFLTNEGRDFFKAIFIYDDKGKW
ncbi:hypothetical protein GCM10023116_04020 [Kistimonas scapharcae]|uniref:Uncharacterized protein n=1 Tax=Kistimonas scapharcae TaxID=1036133 RepID=A0ABP8UW48_9GAMM